MTEAGGDADPGVRQELPWDVALSFAGAQRAYVGQVAQALKARGVRCFYDADEQVRLWGTHLEEELPRIYARESASVVVFVSADYAAGDWTQLESRAAFSRAVAEAGVYVLPARFDDSELPGLLPDVVYVDLSRYGPAEFAELVVAKLADLKETRPSVEDLQTQFDKELDRVGRVGASERIEQALQRLGSDQPAIRIGAVHTLAEIAATAPGERPSIAQILSTHLRSEAPGPGPDGDSTYLLPTLQVRLPVAQAIVTVLTNGQFSETDLSHADLCGANLANRDMRKADLRKVNLRCADLRMADLRGADLREANLTGAKVAGALLAGAQVMDAYLAEMDLTEVDLSEIVLVRVNMSRSRLAGVDLSGRDDLYYSIFQYADLTGANLSGTELRGAQFCSAKLHNADLTCARMVKANLKGAKLDGTRMRYADLAKADLTYAGLKGTDLRGASLEEADLTGAYLKGTDLRGACLLDADLSQIVDMRDVRIDRHTQEQGKLRHRSPLEVHMEEDDPDDDPLTSAP